jgi:hypothetical protein
MRGDGIMTYDADGEAVDLLDHLLIKSLEILPSVTACRCSQRASMAQFG